MRRAVVFTLAALALVCAAPAYATRTVAVDAANAVHSFVVGTDGALYHAPPGGVLERVGGAGLVQEPVAAVRDAAGTIVVAARGEDGTVYVLPDGDWSAREPVATGAAGAPDLLLNADNRLELYFRGVDGKLWWTAQTLTGWADPEALGGSPAGEPAAILDSRPRSIVFVRETDSELRVWVNDGGWANAPLGGPFPGDPAVARDAGGRLTLFARGQDGTPWFTRQPDASAFTFSFFTSHSPVQIVGDPSVVTSGDGALHVFARGADGALWWTHNEPANNIWSLWESLGGTLAGDPVAIRNRFGLVEVVAPAAGGAWTSRAQTAPATWEPGFRSLGEPKPPADPPPVVVVPAPAPPPVIVSPTYVPKRLLVDLVAGAKAGKTSTVFKTLTVKGVPAGATVTVTCAKGCKRTSLTFRNVNGTVSLKALFAKRAKQGTLKAGTKIRVAVSAPNMIGAVKTLTVRPKRAPTVATRCLAPGATTETLCAA
ncbi:hypothetical protein OJ997_06410 [Solirubrobacter phytolaccae]|uniref:PLL-like beta propeller domain-containing protein n=1 Tax=Solirubrobacter phytolaccae TaxID=1404360 RepID=A0A9X3N966_9ACTN|nr:hypothetical protein [Solirubrobacter phytolaccae]MDA0179921.1 hypothetical protein [Solirubrobacter phytolaccae]